MWVCSEDSGGAWAIVFHVKDECPNKSFALRVSQLLAGQVSVVSEVANDSAPRGQNVRKYLKESGQRMTAV